MKRFVTSYPILFGILIALLISGAIFLVGTWSPWTFEYLGRHKRIAQAILFTTIYFVVYVYGLRRWRHQGAFWPTILALFFFHVIGIFLYSTHVQPILVWQWPIVGLLEYFAAAFFLDWSRRKPRAGGPVVE